MRALRSEVLEPGPELLAEILRALDGGGERHALRALLGRHRAAYLGGLGLAAATAAGAAGALVLTSRSRRGRVHLAG
jgi:hypothetical protein